MINRVKQLRYRWKNIRLTYKLLLVYMPLILLPTLFGMYYLTDSYSTTSQYQTTTYTTDLLNLMGDKIDDRLMSYEQLSRQIMTDAELLNLITKSVDSVYEKYQIQTQINEKLNSVWLGANQNSYIRAILIETSNSMYVYGKNSIDNFRISDKTYMGQVLAEKGGALWSDPMLFSDGFREVEAFRLGRSIRNVNLKEVGILTLVIDSRAITDLFAQTSLSNAAFKLLNQHNKVILDNGVIISDQDQNQLLFIFRERMHAGWRLSAELPLRELYEPIYRTVKISMLVILLCVLLGLVLTYLLVLDLVIPIRKLIVNMKRGLKGVGPDKLNRFNGAIEIVEINDNFISLMYEIEQLISEIGKQEHKKKEAEIRVLQNQLSPHFLYNTLNTIRWMAIIQKQNNIKEMVDALNKILTYGLRGDKNLVSLKTDLDMLDHYVNIQRVRFQYFEFIKEIPFYLEAVLVPKFLLQPVVENALIHGLAQANRPGEIRINADVIVGNLILTVKDNGIGMDENQLENVRHHLREGSQHFGIHSINERIQLQYGISHGLEIFSTAGEGTVVKIKIPLNIHNMKE